jgi:hypothetical protein
LRDHLVLQINGAEPLGLRQGPWKLVTRRPGSAGEGGVRADAELYNLDEDLAETINLAAKYPEKVDAMISRLQQVREHERSRP